MSTHNVCFCGEKRKILCGYPIISEAMWICSLIWSFNACICSKGPSLSSIMLQLRIKNISILMSKVTAYLELADFLTLKMPRKPASEKIVCLYRLLNSLATFQTYFCIEANSVDPDQTAPRGAV